MVRRGTNPCCWTGIHLPRWRESMRLSTIVVVFAAVLFRDSGLVFNAVRSRRPVDVSPQGATSFGKKTAMESW